MASVCACLDQQLARRFEIHLSERTFLALFSHALDLRFRRFVARVFALLPRRVLGRLNVREAVQEAAAPAMRTHCLRTVLSSSSSYAKADQINRSDETDAQQSRQRQLA